MYINNYKHNISLILLDNTKCLLFTLKLLVLYCLMFDFFSNCIIYYDYNRKFEILIYLKLK